MQPIRRRDRLRTQARAEAKALALQQLADAGPNALSLNGIARQMGITGPALYRYFADRDALLNELVVDAYGDLAAAVAVAVDAPRSLSAEARFRAFADAYRAWALSQPHRYRLLFDAPVPGFPAHSERLIAAAQHTMASVVAILRELPWPAAFDAAAFDAAAFDADRPVCVDSRLDSQVEGWAISRGMGGVPPVVLRRALLTWSRLHGLISLEIGGNFASMGIDAAELFAGEVRDLMPRDDGPHT
jgi:AcrR family transcriptional regulator